jgi:hypothetical protein
MTADAPNIDVRVGQYVKLRDLIKAEEDAHKEKMKPKKELLEKFNAALLAYIKSQGAGVDSVATALGTVSKSVKRSASIADMSAFWNYCVTQGDFDMVDKKANVARVVEYVEANNGELPPGVNLSQIEVVNVRRKTGT